MPPEMIVFDCDGVLVDSEVLSVTAMATVMNEAGIPVTYPMIARYFGMKTADIVLKIAEETGADVDLDVLPRIWPRTRDLFAASLKPTPGIKDFIEAHRGLKRCVASSSSPERIRASLTMTGLIGYFEESIFSSSQVARGKPAPDLFLFAAAGMGVDPAACVVIEDSRFGVAGARAAGMRAFGYAGGSHMEPHHSDLLREAGAEAVETSWDAIGRHLFGPGGR